MRHHVPPKMIAHLVTVCMHVCECESRPRPLSSAVLLPKEKRKPYTPSGPTHMTVLCYHRRTRTRSILSHVFYMAIYIVERTVFLMEFMLFRYHKNDFRILVNRAIFVWGRAGTAYLEMKMTKVSLYVSIVLV